MTWPRPREFIDILTLQNLFNCAERKTCRKAVQIDENPHRSPGRPGSLTFRWLVEFCPVPGNAAQTLSLVRRQPFARPARRSRHQRVDARREDFSPARRRTVLLL